MTTRYYLAAATLDPTVTGFVAGVGWNGTVSVPALASMDTTKSGTSQTIAGSGGITNPHNRYAGTFIGPKLAAQTITGTIKGQVRTSDLNPGDDRNAQMQVKFVSADGSVVRGTVLALDNSALSNEFALALTNRKFPKGSSGAALTSLDIQAGDRPVVEIGMRRYSTSGSNSNFDFRDDNASDLPEDETTTTALNSWIEFSMTLALFVAGGAELVGDGRLLGGELIGGSLVG